MSALALSARESEMPRLPVEIDLFGRIVWDHFAGKSGYYFLRRSDNYVERDSSARYFRSWDEFPDHHRCLLSHASGRVLDVGAGAGQHSLALQQRGLEVTAIDTSPGALAVSRERGVADAREMDALALDFAPESFDTVLLLGNCLGIAGTPEGLRGLLRGLHRVVRSGGQILAELCDYSATRDPSHLRYHAVNRALGRYPGSIRLRLEYDGKCGPEFDWLLTSLSDLRAACAETGWRIKRCVQVNAETTYAIGMARE